VKPAMQGASTSREAGVGHRIGVGGGADSSASHAKVAAVRSQP